MITALTAVAAEPWQVSWLTVDPGLEVYELEGHTALRMRSGDHDIVLNWGVFDFNTPGFVWRFALGQTDYMVQAVPTRPFVDFYSQQGRTIVEQPLNLTPEQSRVFYNIVDSLLSPGKSVYRYNYVLDNCATRPLHYIERSCGSQISLAGGAESLTEATFRSEMSRYHRDYPWYQFGIDLALGSLIDRPVTQRQHGYAPVNMQHIIDRASVTDASGHTLKLAGDPVVLNPGITRPTPDPTPWWATPTAAGWVLFALILIISIRDFVRRRPTRPVDTLLFGVMSLIGCVLLFLVVFSTHYATSPNWNLLWLNPLALIAAVGTWLPRARRVLNIYFALNIIALIALTIIYITGVQMANAAFAPLIGCSALRSALYLALWQKRIR